MSASDMQPTGWRNARLRSMRSRGWRPFSKRATASVEPAEPTGDLLLDERTLARLRRLSLVAGRARTEGLAGEHRSRRRGASPEFADFKRYSQGDDFRRIDWNTYARLDSLFVRLSEVTTELSVHFLLDSSASMDWRGNDDRPTKFTAARCLTGALAYIALWGFDRVSIVPFAEALGRPYGPVQGRSQVVPVLRHLQRMQPMGGTALTPAIGAYAHGRSRRGLLFLVSDLLSGEPEELQAALHDLRARGWQTAVLHIVDEAEVATDAAAAWLTREDDGIGVTSLELVDRESGAILRLAPDDDLVARYAAGVTTWLDGSGSGLRRGTGSLRPSLDRLGRRRPDRGTASRAGGRGVNLLAPLGLAALVAIPVIILFHMRHTTPTRRPVPSLRFWEAANPRPAEARRLRRPPLSLPLLLQIAAAALLAVALARPATAAQLAALAPGLHAEPRHLILLLDGSTSMSATPGATSLSRWEAARLEALDRLAPLRQGDVATVILMGTRPVTLTATDDASLIALRERLALVAQPGGRADLDGALALAGDLFLPNLERQVVVISDGAVTADPAVVAGVDAPVALVIAGGAEGDEERANLAVIDVSARPSPNGDGTVGLYTSVANFGPQSLTVPVSLQGDGLEIGRSDVTIAGGGAVEPLRWLLPPGVAELTVRIEQADALPPTTPRPCSQAKPPPRPSRRASCLCRISPARSRAPSRRSRTCSSPSNRVTTWLRSPLVATTSSSSTAPRRPPRRCRRSTPRVFGSGLRWEDRSRRPRVSPIPKSRGCVPVIRCWKGSTCPVRPLDRLPSSRSAPVMRRSSVPRTVPCSFAPRSTISRRWC